MPRWDWTRPITITVTARALALLALAGVVLVAAAVLLVAARGGTKETPAAADVRATVNDFATSSDADACDLLTEEALQRVYGGKARCVEKSKDFQGGAIRIQDVHVAQRRGTVKAESLDGKTLFTVKLEKARTRSDAPRGWQISNVESRVK
jgi:hypothetical protein